MTYDAIERSTAEAQPIELYAFQVYTSEFLFTSAAEDQVVQLRRYRQHRLHRSEPQQSGEIARNFLTIRSAPDFPMTSFYNGTPPSTVVLVRILRMHRQETVPTWFWGGRVLSCKFEDEAAVFHCENIHTTLRRPGLRRLYGRGCPYALYGPECRAIEAEHRVSAALVSVSGRTLESPAFGNVPDGRWAGGFITIDLGAGPESRTVLAHVGDLVVLTHAIPGLASGMTVEAVPGCAHDEADCEDVFDNLRNYGGLGVNMAGRNPFGPNGVF